LTYNYFVDEILSLRLQVLNLQVRQLILLSKAFDHHLVSVLQVKKLLLRHAVQPLNHSLAVCSPLHEKSTHFAEVICADFEVKLLELICILLSDIDVLPPPI